MLSLSALVMVVVWLIVVGIIVWLLIYLVDSVGIPEPFHKVAKALILIVAVLVCIALLLSLTGGPQLFRP